MIIDCDECELKGTDACEDCFVMAVLSRKEHEPLVLEPEEEEAIQVLREAGLAPVIKFRRKAV